MCRTPADNKKLVCHEVLTEEKTQPAAGQKLVLSERLFVAAFFTQRHPKQCVVGQHGRLQAIPAEHVAVAERVKKEHDLGLTIPVYPQEQRTLDNQRSTSPSILHPPAAERAKQ